MKVKKMIIVQVLLMAVILLNAGIIISQEAVTGGDSADTVSDEQLPEVKVHRVTVGEDLHLLAAKYYGNPRLWYIIYNANKNSIQNPNMIHPGQIIYIPKKQ